MKASVSSWSYRQWFDSGKIDLLGFIDEVKRIGGDGIEIFPKHVDPDDVPGALGKAADKARAAGLGVASVIAGNNFNASPITERARIVEKMKVWIAACAAAGIRRMNTFTGYHRPGDDPALDAFRVIDCYREVAPLAEQHDVTLCIENHSSVARDADALLAVIRAVDSSHVRTNPDPSNFVPDFTIRGDRAKEAIYTEAELIAPLMANAHLKVGDFTPDGDHAHLDVARIIGIFQAAGYDGDVVLEVYGDHAAAPDDACRKGIALLRKHF